MSREGNRSLGRVITYVLSFIAFTLTFILTGDAGFASVLTF